MADFTPDLKRLISKAGCAFERQGKGDHEIWYSPITGKRFVVDTKIKSRHTANGVLNRRAFRKDFNLHAIAFISSKSAGVF